LKKKPPQKKKRSRGQPTRYKPEYIEQGYKLAVKGFTDKEIADFFKVRTRTIYNWKEKHPEFFQALKNGKYELDSGRVVNTLLRRALGYQYTEKTQELSRPDAKTGKRELFTTKIVTKELAPDPTSIIFWLKNRQPEEWRDKHSYEHGLTPEVLRAILSGLPKDFSDSVRKELARLSNIRNG
jgi:transposase